jgi:hypothetical protein
MKAYSKFLALILLSFAIALFTEAPIAAQNNSSTICIPNRIAGPINEPGNYAAFKDDIITYETYVGDKPQAYLYQISTDNRTPIINQTFGTSVSDIEGDLILVYSLDPATPNYPENGDLFLYRISTGEIITRITNSPVIDGGGGIEGDYVAWSTDFFDYYLYRISTGEIKNINPTFAYGMSSYPAFQGDVIAWSYQKLPSGSGSDIAYHRISTGETKAVGAVGTTDGEAPDIEGDYIVWQLYDGVQGPIGGDIALFNVVTEQLTMITDDDIYDGRPVIEGDYVIWERFDGNDDEIFQYQISTGITTQLTDTPVNESFLNLRDGYIVYSDSKFSLHVMERSTGEITTINKSLTMWMNLYQGGFITDAGRLLYFPIGLQDIYLYDPANPDPCAPNLLRNGSFENGFRNWTGTGRTKDTVKCTDRTIGQIYSYHQKCGFRFLSSATENSSISQTINLRQSGLKSGDKLTFGAWVWPVRALPKGRITALVTLKSGQTQRVGIPFPQTTSGGFTLLKKTITLNGAPASLKFTISNQSTKREVRLDRAFVFVEPPAGEMTSLPAAQPVTDGLRGSN